jgi:hypothetical protein
MEGKGLRRLRQSFSSPFRRNRRMLFYALGSGLGHLSRAHAIVRKLVPLFKGELFLLTNCPHSYMYCQENVTTLYLNTSRGSPEFQGKKIKLVIEEVSPHILVVDAFPRGITGELVDQLARGTFRKILIRRILRADYSGKSIDEFVANHYDLVIHAEPISGSPIPYPYHLCCPILLRDYEELRGADDARRILRVPSRHRILLTIGTGDPLSVHNFRRLLAWIFVRLRIKGFSLRHGALPIEGALSNQGSMVNHFPLIEALKGADLIVASSGYNLYHESQALTLPSLYIPQPKSYDDQFRRAGALAVSSPDELEERLEKLMEDIEGSDCQRAPYINRAAMAARIIADC